MHALVVGAAQCVWNDLNKIDISGFDLIAVNHVGGDLSFPIKVWCTLHPEQMGPWVMRRQFHRYNMDYDTWTKLGQYEEFPIHHRTVDWGGSSGLLAVKVALELGYKKIVLAGVPLDTQSHYYDNSTWLAGAYQGAWQGKRTELSGKVKSLSGWTREFLGYPDEDWLNG